VSDCIHIKFVEAGAVTRPVRETDLGAPSRCATAFPGGGGDDEIVDDWAEAVCRDGRLGRAAGGLGRRVALECQCYSEPAGRDRPKNRTPARTLEAGAGANFKLFAAEKIIILAGFDNDTALRDEWMSRITQIASSLTRDIDELQS
jgi:hypothetical protein